MNKDDLKKITTKEVEEIIIVSNVPEADGINMVLMKYTGEYLRQEI